MTLRFVEEWEYHEIAAAQAQRSGAMQDKPPYWVFFFCEIRLNRCRTHWPSIRLLSRTRPRHIGGSIRRFPGSGLSAPARASGARNRSPRLPCP